MDDNGPVGPHEVTMRTKQTSGLGRYSGEHLNHVAFPMGGMGAGMICLEGTGAFSHVSLRHAPNVFSEPAMFAALYVKGARTARLVEGPVPMRKAFGAPGTGNGAYQGRHHGLPRFARAEFRTRFPFGQVALSDSAMPVDVTVTGWSPFVPGDSDSASMPVAGVEYRLRNRTTRPVTGVFSFHASNFMKSGVAARGAIHTGPRHFVVSDAAMGASSSGSPFVGSWSVSRLLPPVPSIGQVPCVRLSDDYGWAPAPMAGYFANVHEHHSAKDGLVYIGTRVQVARAGTWLFSIGHDGPMRLFVDGQALRDVATAAHPLQPGRTSVRVDLTAGDHEIMLAFDTQGGSAWGVSLAFELPAGTQGQDAAVYPTPERWGVQSVNPGSFAVATDERSARTDGAWLRGGHFDMLTKLWEDIAAGKPRCRPPHAEGPPAGGASLYVPFTLKPRAERTVRLRLAWYVPTSSLQVGGNALADGKTDGSTYVPWYAARFRGIDEITAWWAANYDALRAKSQAFSDCFYDTTLPAEAIDAVAANLTILKSPTVLRQADGRLWGWEGCCDGHGCCAGTCTHVWNYAQALCHLFPDLERTLRETEFLVNQDGQGHQTFRAALPIQEPSHKFHAAADGQLGGIMKVYRDWRIGGDTAWMARLWPRVRQSLDYCIETWDPGHTGMTVEPHHNTYDIEFWGADGMCTSFYLGALQAAILMGRALMADVNLYEQLLAAGRKAMERALWNGEYFIQKIQWTGLRAGDPTAALSLSTTYLPETLAIMKKEGPKYQYGKGCLSDGVLGDWMARVCGVAPVLDADKVDRHVRSVFRYNFRESLADHANPQRPGYAFGTEAGLLLCSWPKGGKLSLPFIYSDEVWTGIEYQAAAHLIMFARVKEGLRIVRAVRSRYDGRYRNPFNEYECGHWYARAMSSYSLLQALSGARYDAVAKTLSLRPAVKGDFRAFLSTATGYGTVGVKRGKPFLTVVSGRIDVREINYEPAE